MSKKVSRAEDQQERLITTGWIVGFVDGEGCFSINFVRQSDKKEKNRIRKGYKTGYQIFYEFAITQGESSLGSLEKIKDFFGVGKIYLNKRYDNHKEHLLRYTVRKLDDLVNIIVPFFKKNELRTSKKKNFEIFTKCLGEISKGKHLTINGAVKIAHMMEKMNHKKNRSDVIRILRNQTSNSA
ncbi:MAG: hypothetical protein A2566_02025 [Candidatus Zambryskibacteria bacterium RIFOXYD1_FULL_40_13]|nr:MAG: LAGLIDADG homing endonuclease [Parcubacteria group bacterium GW2011_GWC2_40_10]KKR51970.1 MAG: LAGLIDADG homing endonuclease [Parcubacteria group bacterium GW2011_GWE1_40_20]KKR68471.1 MAG: LAGLIDADG homing endonuclease [Parcubacteria group bacterium GW2011_GWF2_40_69]KKS35881.1 MAG: LAGLIDADG homing endonuclease [Parcubacteria group bacterium GW2011_GWE2_42_14]OHB15700.1 MAG: hypothetical protein A2566_02025 [Candidatus Zambryskibacteria bacterium RIFOXYD1_FULL_40_13]HBD25154.1 endonu